MEKAIDNKLLREFIRGCHDSFCIIYNTYKDKVYFYCYKICKNSEDAKELVQSIFIKIWENRSKIDPERPIEPYLFTIVRNHTFDYLKSLSMHQMLHIGLGNIELPSSNTEDAYEFTEYQNITSRIIDKLPEMRQIIFKMKYEEGLEVKQIAKMLNISPNTVKSQLNKASKTIREYINTYMNLILLFLLIG